MKKTNLQTLLKKCKFGQNSNKFILFVSDKEPEVKLPSQEQEHISEQKVTEGPNANNSSIANKSEKISQLQAKEILPQQIEKEIVHVPIQPSYVEIIKKIRVDDKEIQTDLGPVQFADKGTRELRLEATLNEEKKKAKKLILQYEEQESKLLKMQECIRKGEIDIISLQRQLATANDTIKKLMSDNKDSIHAMNLLKDEQEAVIQSKKELIYKIEELEKDKRLIEEESKRRIKFAEERADQKNQNLETRAIQEIIHKQEIEKAMMNKQIDDKDEELHFYKKKCEMMEAENVSLNITNKTKVDAENKIRELQQEIYTLKLRTGNEEVKKEVEKNEECNVNELKKEIQSQETLIKGYQKENENMTKEIWELKKKNKEMEGLMYKENVKMREEKNKLVRENDKVMIVENSGEAGIDALNKLGHGNIITVEELKSIKHQVEMLQLEKKKLEEQVKKAEQCAKAEVAVLLKQQQELEDNYGINFEGMKKEKELKKKLESELQELQEKYKSEVSELKGRIKFLVENQELVEKNAQLLKQKDEEISTLKGNNNNKEIPIESAKNNTGNPKRVKFADQATNEKEEKFKQKIKELEKQIKDNETSYETKLRTLRQQHEKLKLHYEQRDRKQSSTAQDQAISLRTSASIGNKFTAKVQSILKRLKASLQQNNENDIKKFIKEFGVILETPDPRKSQQLINLKGLKASLEKLVFPRVNDLEQAMEIIKNIEKQITTENDQHSSNNNSAASSENNIEATTNEMLWSDFSDNENEEDENEKQLAKSTLSELQKWIKSSDLTIEFIQGKYDPQHTGYIQPNILFEVNI